MREVKEETGIGHLELIRFLVITEHEYVEGGQSILKETHWWLMKTNRESAAYSANGRRYY